MHVEKPGRLGAVHQPWFRERPEFTVVVAGLSFLAVFVVRLLIGDATDGFSMLYMLPVALLATAFGRRAGLIGGLVGVGLVAAWVLVNDVPLSAFGWINRIVPLLLLGGLIGDASDKLRQAEEERVRLVAAARLHQEAIEINDSLVQGMVAAKWAIEAGRTESGLATLEDTIAQGHELVSGLIREAGLGKQTARQPAGSAQRVPTPETASEPTSS